MVEEDSLRGVTSNPAIFEKAILGSPEYDEDIRLLAEAGLRAPAIYRRLPRRRHPAGRDILLPLYAQTGGKSTATCRSRSRPDLAHEHRSARRAGKRLWRAVDRPNLMIKIPGTRPGRPGDRADRWPGHERQRDAAVRGHAYEQVMEAFIRATERRHAENLPLDRHSVASFFVSRVDTAVDRQLEDLGRWTRRPGRPGQRPRRLPGVPARLRRRALRRPQGGEALAAEGAWNAR